MMITRFPGLFIAFLIYVPPLLHANTGASDSFQAGFELYEQDKYDLAIPFLEKAVKLEPDNAIYHHILAKSYGREAERVNWLSAINLAKKTLSHLEIAANLDSDNLEILDDLMEYYREAPSFLGGDDKKANEIEKKIKLLSHSAQKNSATAMEIE